MTVGGAGHRILEHTADVMIEAWGPTRVACLEEAARALVETFADTHGVKAADAIRVAFHEPTNDGVLLAVLDEIVYLVDALGAVPVDAAFEETEAGGIVGRFHTVPVVEIEAIGAPPKGVSRSDLELRAERGRWHCRALIDV